jgi:hypothetical protein
MYITQLTPASYTCQFEGEILKHFQELNILLLVMIYTGTASWKCYQAFSQLIAVQVLLMI